MKKINASCSWIITLVLVLCCIAALGRHSSAAPLKSARISRVIQDVRLLRPSASPRPAVVNDQVSGRTAVRTGAESRTELTFSDLTITRLGENTIFSLSEGDREVRLDAGSILLEVPPNAPEATIKTAAVTAAITGGTALFAVGPPQKFMLLEGTGLFYPTGHPEQAVHLHGGEMVMMINGHITPVTTFDVALALKTSHLIIDFDELANLALILNIVQQQYGDEQFTGAPGPPPPRDIIEVADQSRASSPVLNETPTPTPTATPSATPTATPTKFGTPAVISSPNPYVITSGTVITTDPSITTNGVTDFGKIYRGPTDDGSFSMWAYGSTSAFDTELNLDTEFFSDPSNLPIAVFKFQSLSLNGNPTIDTTNGVTNLGLIGVDGITSGPPGGALTFTGLDGLYLGTVNGSINLTSDISFSNLGVLAIYARGGNSDLTINSPISNIGRLALAGQHSLELTNPGTMTIGQLGVTAGNLAFQIGGSLLLDGKVRFDAVVLPGDTIANGANVTVNIDGDFMNSSTSELSRLRVENVNGNIGTGGNISADFGGNFMTGSDTEFVVGNTNGTINNGGNITIGFGGNVSSGGSFDVLVENYDETANPAGHIVGGGSISLMTSGNLSADAMSVAINNRGGGMIDSAVSLVVNIGGVLTTLHDGQDFLGNPESLSIAISNRYDDTSGNTQASAIGGNATLNVHADSASIGGMLSVVLSDRGGSIGGDALLNFGITHSINIAGTDMPNFADAAEIELLNDSGAPDVADSPLGGTIHGNAGLQIQTGNLNVSAGSLDVLINNQNRAMTGGTIDGDATVNLTASAISVHDFFDAEIKNSRGADATGLHGGSIGGDATLNISASSLSVGGELDVDITNFNNGAIGGESTGGSIGGDAAINLGVTGNLMSTGAAFFGIFNQSNVGTSPGGTIAGDARVEVTAGTVSIGDSLSSFINTNGGGQIMGDAINSIIASGNLMAHSGIDQEIDDTIFGGSSGGHIDGDAAVTLGGANITTPSTNSGIPGQDPMAIEASIYTNAAGFVGGDATVTVTAAQDISAPGSVLFWVANGNYQNLGGGMIGGNAEVNVTATNLSSGDLFTQILNYGDASIGGNAIVDVTANALSVGGNLDALIDNRSGQIGMSATIDYSVLGLLESQGNMMFRILNNGLSHSIGKVSGGTIDGDAAINVAAANLHASTLLAQIDNTVGQITSDATIQFNVSGTAMVDNDATVAIDGNSGEANTAVTFNNGTYNVGGTFRSTISEDGLMTFNNVNAQADVLKAGVFGPNGTLNVGGGMLSGNTELKLYAPGSNGSVNFVSSVTLSGSVAAPIIAANTVTIFDGVVVTISNGGFGSSPAMVFTNVPNYTGSGGNGHTTGMFSGNATTQPLANAPPFDPTRPARSRVIRGGGTGHASDARVTRDRATADTLNLSNTSQLLSLLDDAAPGPGGKISIASGNRAGHSKDSGRLDTLERLRANRADLDRRRMHDRPLSRTVALQ